MSINIFFNNYSRWTKINIDEISGNITKIFRNLYIKKVKKNDPQFLRSKLCDRELDFQFFQDNCIIKNIKDQLDFNKIPPFSKGTNDALTSNSNKSNNPEYFMNESGNDFHLASNILMYDGIILQKLYQEILSELGFEFNLSELYILIIDDLICSFDEIDWKYHARSMVCGNPTLISTSGLRYGLAKPKDYYLKLLYYHHIPQQLKKLDNEYSGRFIENNDDRINSIIEVLAIQSIYYFIKGDYFCEDPTCRLYNAHWQEEMLRLSSAKNFCRKHFKILRELL